jgi:hypothetical protein
VQSEEARLEFDKEPGHDKLKVSVLAVYHNAEQTDIQYRRKQIRCWSKSLCTTTLRRRILVGDLCEATLERMNCVARIPMVAK